MRKLATLVVGIATLAAAQTPLYRDATGNVAVFATSGRVQIDKGHWVFDATSKGSPVHVMVRNQGVDFFADRVHGVIGTKGGQTQLDQATATGNVRFVKVGSGARSELLGAKAAYVASGTLAKLTATGGVRLTDSRGKQSIVARAAKATATLSPGPRSVDPLRSATLEGSVVVDGRQRVSAAETKTLHVTALRMELDNTVNPAKLTLSGGVVATGSFGRMTLSTAILTIDDQGEIVSISGSR